MAKAEEVLKELKSNRFAPVYFLHGDEPFDVDRISDYIEENALTETERGFNQTVTYGRDTRMQEVLDNARRFPMMAKRQVVIVKEAQEIQDFNKKDAQSQLAAYCQAPVPSTVLVLCHKHKKLDGRSELSKVLKKHAVLVDTKKLYDNQLPGWVKSFCREKGHSIGDKAALMLAEYIGNNLNRIANEIGKMLLNAQEKVEITEKMVLDNVGISRDFNTFELQAALAKRDILKANRIINFFAANPKDHPVIPVISLLFSYFSKVLMLHQNRNMGKEELARLLKVNPFFVQEYQLAARNYPQPKALAIIHFLHQADLQSKGIDYAAKNHEVLKELVYKILH